MVPCRRSEDEERGAGQSEEWPHAGTVSKRWRHGSAKSPGTTNRRRGGRNWEGKARKGAAHASRSLSHMHGMQCHVCRKRWGGSIRGYLIRRGANPLKGELAPLAQRLTTGVVGRQKKSKREEIREAIYGDKKLPLMKDMGGRRGHGLPTISCF